MTCICRVSISGAWYWHLGQRKSGTSSAPGSPAGAKQGMRNEGAGGTVLKAGPGNTSGQRKKTMVKLMEIEWGSDDWISVICKFYSTLWRRNVWSPWWKVFHVSHLHFHHTCTTEMNSTENDYILQCSPTVDNIPCIMILLYRDVASCLSLSISAMACVRWSCSSSFLWFSFSLASRSAKKSAL